MNESGKRRMIQILVLMPLLFGAVCARLAWLQFGPAPAAAGGTAISKDAVSQRSDGIIVDRGRGRFLDRNGRPFTGITVRSLVAFPDYGMPRGSDNSVAVVAKTLGTTPGRLASWLARLKEPEVWKAGGAEAFGLSKEQARVVQRSGLLGVAVLSYRNRYPDVGGALHAVGYQSQDPERLAREYPGKLADQLLSRTDLIGGSGLEKSMDRLLLGAGPTVVNQLTDAARRPLAGLGLRMTAPDNPHFPLQVRTTMDLDIQHAVEQVLRAGGVKQGAAVVLDASNADILAMASLPRLDPYRIGAPATDERNHAVTAYPPGSVFKMITLAAALESGEADLKRRYRCDGRYPRYGLKCWKHEGHGLLTLEEAFAESCNVAFAALADRMDPAWIQITAERLGLGRKVGWASDSFTDGKPLRLLGEEEPGVIFKDKRAAADGGVRTGTGIGQRDVRVTPLQAANLMVTLLHGGRVAAPRLVTEIRYADGGWMAKLPVQPSISKYGAIRPDTAADLLTALRSVVTAGTAREALAASKWPLAGKSGTAELAGKQKNRNDHWFVGYGPAGGNPKYAVAILIQDQPAGLRNRAAVVFGDVMERLRLLENRHPDGHPGVRTGKR